jgi:hypothetical protein
MPAACAWLLVLTGKGFLFMLCADEDPVAQAFVQRRASLTQEQWDTFLSVKVLMICHLAPDVCLLLAQQLAGVRLQHYYV